MTTYKGIKGLSLQTVAGDPSNLAVGDIWYDSVAKKIQGAKIAAGTWATGGTLGTARYSTGGPAAAGTQTAGLIFGGATAPATADTEEYNGSSWSAVVGMVHGDMVVTG